MPHKTGLLVSKLGIGDPNAWPKCHWYFQETCHLERYHPTPCQIERCQNFTHTTCAALWCCKNHVAIGDPKRVGLFCREHLPRYFGILYSRESYKHNLPRDFILQPEACEGDTYEPCVGDLNSNGLWFAPKCKKCFLTNKYLHMRNKLCTHPWEEVQLNITGQYILLNSSCWHHGYFSNMRKSVYVTAQLFCVPSQNHQMDCITRNTFSRGVECDFILGALKKEQLNELTKQAINNWNGAFPVSQFKPCPYFQYQDIDPESNRQIEREDFNKVTLIKKLAHMFKDIFPYLTVAQVWLIRKSKEEHGFQGWHQDKVANITRTIVLNLGSEDVNADNVQGEVVNPIPDVDDGSLYHLKRIATNMMLYKYQGKGAKHPQQFITYEQRLMEKYFEATCCDKIMLEGGHVRSEEESTSQSIASSVCKLSIEKKNRKQEGQAVKHMAQCGKAAQDNGCEVGAILTLKVDYCTH